MIAAALLPALFWLCLGLMVYSYAGYPLLVLMAGEGGAGRKRTGAGSTQKHVVHAAHRQSIPSPGLTAARVRRRRNRAGRTWPLISLLIAAHNEERVIERRIRNALAADYPRDRLEVLVVSDGSTDNTPRIVRRYGDRGVQLVDLPERRGKLNAITAGVAQARGELLVFSDASTQFDDQVLRQLAQHFDAPDVGVVCGRLVLQDQATGTNVDGLYWRYETFVKRCEARLGALVGASGAIYALRRKFFVAPPAHLVIDDFVIPLLARLRHGCRIIYEERAVASQSTPANLRSEFARRARIGAGGFQSIRVLWKLLHPQHGWLAVAYLSHKILRWLCPFFMLGLLLTSAALSDQLLYRWACTMQCLFYLVAAGGLFLRGRGRGLKFIRMTTMFSMMNLALLLGFWRWLLGLQTGVWQRTVR